jgi:hypothetical protein
MSELVMWVIDYNGELSIDLVLQNQVVEQLNKKYAFYCHLCYMSKAVDQYPSDAISVDVHQEGTSFEYEYAPPLKTSVPNH